jgi:hypothetical protein
MRLRRWSERLDRRAQERWRRPYVAPAYFGGALALLLYGLLVAASPTMPLTFAAVWFVLAIVSVVARARDRR